PFSADYYAAHLPLHRFPTRRSSDLTLSKPPRSQACSTRRRASARAPPAVCPCTSSASRFGSGTWFHSPSEHSSKYPEPPGRSKRSEEHTSELQSLRHLVCRLLLEKK